MKLYELEKGDIFYLAGDENSPQFIFRKMEYDYVVTLTDEGVEHLSPFAPVILIKRSTIEK